MTDTKPIRRIAIIGTGVIGASWSSLFLAKGLQVVATDPAPNAEPALRKFVDTAWPGRCSNMARMRRCCGPPTATLSPPALTSTGPSTP